MNCSDKRLISQREGEPAFKTRDFLEARQTFLRVVRGILEARQTFFTGGEGYTGGPTDLFTGGEGVLAHSLLRLQSAI